ncbi:BRO1-like domain-containing protein [Tribonema minus]|uniref:BRO1-like domain-containing protein n=1 Tax=Tribonema minus TaxID=303371 RepID=A0A836CJ99_9STRA|nr:BRO1-like domain-containing protein [Tribonema minus]
MASLVEPANSPAVRKLATLTYRFPLPATKLISFHASFESGNLGDPVTAKAIEHMDQAREDMARELASGNPNYQNVVAGARRYVPLIAQTLYSLEQATDPVYLEAPLRFDWASGLGINPRVTWISNQAVVWDKCMALISQALAHADSVYNMVGAAAGGDDAVYAAAGRELRTAAGVLAHTASEELPRWVGETAKGERPPEAVPGVCEALSTLCLAQAQQMALGKALAGGKTPPTLLAKLCGGVADQMDAALSTLRDKAGAAYAKLAKPLLAHAAFQAALQRALAHLFLASHAWAREAYGAAIAHQRRGAALLARLPPPPDAPPPELAALRAEAAAALASYERDNGAIYYDPVPGEPAAPPDGVVMMKPEPYTVPPLVALRFRPPRTGGEPEDVDVALAAEAEAKLSTANGKS